MKVIFMGPTGVNMKQTMNKLACYCYRKAGKTEDVNNIRSREHLTIYDLEDEIKKITDFTAFLDSDNYKWQESVWEQALERILLQIADQEPEHAFLCTNAPYFRKSRFFPALSIDLLKRFGPDLIVTLIEEAHVAWQRVRTREVIFPTRSDFRLREIFSWRASAILASDSLAKTLSLLRPRHPPLKNYVVAVKHPPQMLHRLIFEPQVLIVYASFPISHTRADPQKRSLIDGFRERLHEHFCVFDPVTIDERICAITLNQQATDTIEIMKAERWPLPHDFPLSEEDEADYPIKIDAEQLKEVVEEVDDHIRFRDFRMISQSRALVAFRPYFGKHLSRGVFSEIFYANNVANIRSFVFWPEEDGESGGTPFEGIGIIRNCLDDLFEDLKKYESRIASEEAR